MKRILSILFTVVCGLACLQAQTVGLVLSGGGAKGIAHIGIIKALEENNVPIDYVRRWGLLWGRGMLWDIPPTKCWI